MTSNNPKCFFVNFTCDPFRILSTYEEFWSNYRNKLFAAVKVYDGSYAFRVANDAQTFLDEMTDNLGTRKLELMKHYDSENLQAFKDAFLSIMKDYLEEYRRVGRTVRHYADFEQLYAKFMKA